MATYPGITARFEFEKPDEAMATLHVTMRVKQWRAIVEALSADKYEEWPLRSVICDLIHQAHQTFYHRTPDEV